MGHRVVVFLYDHFYPDYSAGGPVTSLANLHRLISKLIPVRILTSSTEYSSGKQIPDIEIDKWTEWKGISIWYSPNKNSIKKALKSLSPGTIVYLNGIFSVRYFVYPIWLSKSLKLKVVISPRGMLQRGAMKRGLIKKKLFIAILKNLRLFKEVTWHATDEQEADDIAAYFGKSSRTKTIHNVPRIVDREMPYIAKERGKLRLVYFSLIAEKKNLLFFLQLLCNEQFNKIELDIIGPIKDEAYWLRCLKLIDAIPNNDRVKYKGEITPIEIELIIPNYHALVLPTLGENFGHAIIEMLACSRPVLISDKTPWDDLPINNAGFVLPLIEELWIEALQTMLNWNQSDFEIASLASFKFYQSKFNFEDLKVRYLNLFTSK